MKTIIKILAYPFYLLTRRTYLISGTFKNIKDERMFFRTVFETSFYRFPLNSLEASLGEQFHATTGKVLVTSIQRIPVWIAKYIDNEDYDTQYDFSITKVNKKNAIQNT